MTPDQEDQLLRDVATLSRVARDREARQPVAVFGPVFWAVLAALSVWSLAVYWIVRWWWTQPPSNVPHY